MDISFQQTVEKALFERISHCQEREDTVKLGASLWGFYYRQDTASWPTLPEAVQAVLALDSGMGIEVWGAKTLDGPGVSGKELAALISGCRPAAFVTAHIQAQYWSWNPVNLRREIDLAHHLGAHILVLHPVCLGLEEFDDRPDWPEIVRIAEYARKFGIQLAVENIFDSVWCLDRILDRIGDDPAETNIGICIDIGHAALSKDAGREPVCNYLERYADQLIHLHLHDNHGRCDDHLVPGEGNVDWPRVAGVLEKVGFTGSAVLEVFQQGLSPREGLKRGIKFFEEQAKND